ncbi:hypothetical protein [Pseudomonas sp. Snoq117.2]|uniref:hypothetical protein n=1 Tax=Pseudomonas sp. Snoq117.2 TaxID=1500302 RepID=UPI0011609098|nr:hypothetical protein [Pseudomonas sp. Snoq117.2]
MSKKQRVLTCWVGGNDLKALERGDVGPILSTMQAATFDRIELLCSYPAERSKPCIAWLNEKTDLPTKPYYTSLSSPVHFGEIYKAAHKHLERLTSAPIDLSILISPTTVIPLDEAMIVIVIVDRDDDGQSISLERSGSLE